MDATKKTLTHKPTDDLIAKSLEAAAKIHHQERALKALRETIDGRWDDDRGCSDPQGIDMEVADTEKALARLRRDFAQEESRLTGRLTGLLQTQAETQTRIAEGERALAQYHRDYADILTSALKGFPV